MTFAKGFIGAEARQRPVAASGAATARRGHMLWIGRRLAATSIARPGRRTVAFSAKLRLVAVFE
jgi:hypothetical protein